MSVYSYDVEKLSIAIYKWPSSMMERFPPAPISRRRFVQSPDKSTANNEYIPDFIHWFENLKDRGCLGPPSNGLRPPSPKGTSTRRKNC